MPLHKQFLLLKAGGGGSVKLFIPYQRHFLLYEYLKIMNEFMLQNFESFSETFNVE